MFEYIVKLKKKRKERNEKKEKKKRKGKEQKEKKRKKKLSPPDVRMNGELKVRAAVSLKAQPLRYILKPDMIIGVVGLLLKPM